MESFQIANELMEDVQYQLRCFGNMKFFKNASRSFNTKAKGLYFTLILTLGSYGFTVFLMYIIFVN
jgi:hypothetical protein